MSLRIPSNQIVKSKYTIGKEYIFESTYREYQGYYYELNGKLFAGKEFNINAPILVKINLSNINPLRTNPSTLVYGIISGIKLNTIPPPSIISKSNIFTEKRYFYKKINSNPILIKEINEDTFNSMQSNPLYQTISVGIPKGGFFANQSSLEVYDKIMPGIKLFITSELPPD
jgi:hypothetical protein